jgi:hypothetical protein
MAQTTASTTVAVDYISLAVLTWVVLGACS